MHCENAYHIPNFSVVGYACKTNLPSNTGFRCFGRPQSMYMMECIISDVATVCNIPVHKVCVFLVTITNIYLMFMTIGSMCIIILLNYITGS